MANGGLVPIGYFKDPEKSARTFRVVNGTAIRSRRMATVAADGTLVLYGRRVQLHQHRRREGLPRGGGRGAETTHRRRETALVFGLPDDRFGQRVAAVVSLGPGHTATPEEVIADARHRLAGYKLPKEIYVADQVPRAPNGKANYPVARERSPAGMREQ